MEPPVGKIMSSCIIYNRINQDIIKIIEISSNGLYHVHIPRSQPCEKTVFAAKKIPDCLVCGNFAAAERKTERGLVFEWYSTVGHPYPTRYIIRLSQMFEDLRVVKVPRSILEKIQCMPGNLAKAQRAFIMRSQRDT